MEAVALKPSRNDPKPSETDRRRHSIGGSQPSQSLSSMSPCSKRQKSQYSDRSFAMTSCSHPYTFYVLSASRPCRKTHKAVDSLLVSRYNALLMGERPRGLTQLSSFMVDWQLKAAVSGLSGDGFWRFQDQEHE
eukprot:6564750-Prymnesium_polylepis.3